MSSPAGRLNVATLTISILALVAALLAGVGAIGAWVQVHEQGAAGPGGSVGAAGADGAQGPAGLQGADGSQGPAGLQGADGSQGVAGDRGATGSQGEPGAAGSNGSQGPTGPMGEQGPTGPIGEQGPVGPQGPAGVGTALSTSQWVGGGLWVFDKDILGVIFTEQTASSDDVVRDGNSYVIETAGWYRVQYLLRPSQRVPQPSSQMNIRLRMEIAGSRLFGAERSNLQDFFPAALTLDTVIQANAGDRLTLFFDSLDGTLDWVDVQGMIQFERLA